MNRDDAIRTIAYRLWQEAGQPDGDALRFWLAAEAVYGHERRGFRWPPQD